MQKNFEPNLKKQRNKARQNLFNEVQKLITLSGGAVSAFEALHAITDWVDIKLQAHANPSLSYTAAQTFLPSTQQAVISALKTKPAVEPQPKTYTKTTGVQTYYPKAWWGDFSSKQPPMAMPGYVMSGGVVVDIPGYGKVSFKSGDSFNLSGQVAHSTGMNLVKYQALVWGTPLTVSKNPAMDAYIFAYPEEKT